VLGFSNDQVFASGGGNPAGNAGHVSIQLMQHVLQLPPTLDGCQHKYDIKNKKADLLEVISRWSPRTGCLEPGCPICPLARLSRVSALGEIRERERRKKEKIETKIERDCKFCLFVR